MLVVCCLHCQSSLHCRSSLPIPSHSLSELHTRRHPLTGRMLLSSKRVSGSGADAIPVVADPPGPAVRGALAGPPGRWPSRRRGHCVCKRGCRWAPAPGQMQSDTPRSSPCAQPAQSGCCITAHSRGDAHGPRPGQGPVPPRRVGYSTPAQAAVRSGLNAPIGHSGRPCA